MLSVDFSVGHAPATYERFMKALREISCLAFEMPASRWARPSFEPTTVNSTPLERVPPGMVWIPGGDFSMGANDPPDMDEVGMKATEEARPIHRVYVDGFFMDQTDVTNAQFTTPKF
jgi:formylglycine-generating enzyme required for sulfatase activity